MCRGSFFDTSDSSKEVRGNMQFQSNPKNSDGEMSSERINKVLDRLRYAYSTFHRNAIRWLLSQYGIDDKYIGEVIKKSDDRRELKPIVAEWERFMTEAYRKEAEAAELEHQERISNPQSLFEWGGSTLSAKRGPTKLRSATQLILMRGYVDCKQATQTS